MNVGYEVDMAPDQKMRLEHSQQLVMTPLLQQSIQLLQMSSLEIDEFIENEKLENPLLNDQEEAPSHHDRQSGLQVNGKSAKTSFDDNISLIEKTYADKKDLRHFLSEQLHIAFQNPQELFIGIHLIDQLDESGYFRKDPEEIAKALKVTTPKILHVLKILKTFEPSGVFSQTLQECLSIQLKEQDRLTEKMEILLSNLDILGQHAFEKLQSKCKVDKDTLFEMISQIKSLNPKPTADFDFDIVRSIQPDLYTYFHGEKGWVVEFNEAILPKVVLNSQLYQHIKQQKMEKEDRLYLSEKWKRADWLIRSLHQRTETIYRVATEIIKQQQEFFTQGVSALRPMTLRSIAETLELHESTISRVTTHKYMSTPYGLYELKFFFTTAIARNYQGWVEKEDFSAEAIRHRLKSLIDQEKPNKILSDDALASILQEEGIDLARRTVAKYREALKIPTSAQRKRQKKSQNYFAI